MAACSGGSEDETESGTEAGTTAVEAEGACECDPEAEDASCGEQLCPVAFLHCERDCAAVSQGDEEIEHMDCVLSAMQARTPGFVAWVFTQDVAPSWSWTGMQIFADGSAAILRRATAPCQAEGTPPRPAPTRRCCSRTWPTSTPAWPSPTRSRASAACRSRCRRRCRSARRGSSPASDE
ncbi:hypothetical protein [Nannocystis pusilla]|uniref:hypothetical protein n=1 Tax=Nannocystis pusilla TaxID=889268 RepID=UPI003B7A447E